MQQKDGAIWGYAAVLLAMFISSGNFMFGNLAVKEIPAWDLTFWRTAIALVFVVPFVVRKRPNIVEYCRGRMLKVLILTVTGVVLPPWFIYLAMDSPELIDLSIGYTSIPLFTALFSVALLGERLAKIQQLGAACAFLGALVFAFHGNLAKLESFDPHIQFLWLLAGCATISVYLVLLKRWDVHPTPGEGLFVLLLFGTIILLPGFLNHAVTTHRPFDYSWALWGSIAFIGIGMGALFLHLLNFGTERVGATRATLLTYSLPVFVTVKSVLFRDSRLHVYQGGGALLIIGGVLLVTRFKAQEPDPREVHH